MTRFSILSRAVILALLALYSIPLFTLRVSELGEYQHALRWPSIVIHEAGHAILWFSGSDLVAALGGSLFQVVIPLLFVGTFLVKNRDVSAAGLFLWWAGMNVVDVAPYINDARMLQLTLMGVGTGREYEGHDWEYILTRLGWLNLDVFIARWVLLAGRLIMLAALAGAAAALVLAWCRSPRPPAGPPPDRRPLPRRPAAPRPGAA